MTKVDELRFNVLSEECLLVNWPQLINLEIIREVKGLGEQLNTVKGILECVPAYASLAIYFDTAVLNHESLEKLVLNQMQNLILDEVASNTWKIPVCYDPLFGLDQKKFADTNGVDHEELVHLHTKQVYIVLMRGFQPGFLYMGELDERLHLPRLEKPRPAVQAGSVAIANGQTGIYPLESPGGWNIIGRTPTVMLDFSTTNIISIQQGDRVQFTPISRDVFDQLENQKHVPHQA